MTIIKSKICKICEIEKPLTEYYSQNKKKADGTPYIYYHLECKKCAIEKANKWISDNPEKYKVYKNKYEKKSEAKTKNSIRSKRRRENGKYLEWQRDNKDKIKEYRVYREMNKKHEISKNEWNSCKNFFDNSCAYCGLSIDKHFKLWKGKPKQIDLHKEHVEHTGKNDLSNCVPSCQKCNSSKHTYSLEEWYKEGNVNTRFTKERLDKIHKWLNDDYKLYIAIK